MATYPVKNKQTGETKEVKMSVHDWDQWREDNPDWERYYTPENAPKFGEVGEVYDKLKISAELRHDVLAKVNKMPGSNVKPV